MSGFQTAFHQSGFPNKMRDITIPGIFCLQNSISYMTAPSCAWKTRRTMQKPLYQEHTFCAVWPRPTRQDMHHLVTLCYLFQAKSIFKEQLFPFYLNNNNKNKKLRPNYLRILYTTIRNYTI